MEAQRLRERLENGADAIAAGVRGRLAEAGEQLSRWISAPGSPVPARDDAVVVVTAGVRMHVSPHRALPFVPGNVPNQPADRVFADAEAIEFGSNRPADAAATYRKLSQHPDKQTRAEALLRLGRVLRKNRKFEDARRAYRSLFQLGDAIAGGIPAELAGLDGERLISAAMADHAAEQRLAAQIAQWIDAGRWPLTRGSAEFYREAVTREPKPDSWLLAEAMADLWDVETKAPPSPGGHRMVNIQGRSVLVAWRSNGQRVAAMAGFAERFSAKDVPAGYAYQLSDAAGQRIAGPAAVPSPAVVRIIGDPPNPWMMRVWSTVSETEGRLTRHLLPAMLAIVIVCLWATVYFMARAIRREARVARLQSDFVAAVSHEFRSPLTTVRQLSEMLEMDQVPNEERRRKYYQLLAGESRRLQRLVETLLNFGKLEAGAQQYHFEKVEVRELVGRAVREVSSLESEAATRVRIIGPQPETHLFGDADALALALRNLLENGLKYSPTNEAVEVNWRNGEGRVSISVVDHGPGIPKEEHQAVFQKFVRGRSAIQAGVKGTGVGLAMVRQILSAHGGEISLDSEPGRGSTFTIVIAEAT